MMTRRPFLSRVSKNVMSRDAALGWLAARGGVAAAATTTSAAIAATAPNRCVNGDAMWTPETGVALKLLPSTRQAYLFHRMRRHLLACTIAPSLAFWAWGCRGPATFPGTREGAGIGAGPKAPGWPRAWQFVGLRRDN